MLCRMGLYAPHMGETERRSEARAGGVVDAANRAVAAQLRAERAKADKTQTELAEATGLAVNTIRRLESGERELKMPQLLAIAAALEFSAGAFVDAVQAELGK